MSTLEDLANNPMRGLEKIIDDIVPNNESGFKEGIKKLFGLITTNPTSAIETVKRGNQLIDVQNPIALIQ